MNAPRRHFLNFATTGLGATAALHLLGSLLLTVAGIKTATLFIA